MFYANERHEFLEPYLIIDGVKYFWPQVIQKISTGVWSVTQVAKLSGNETYQVMQHLYLTAKGKAPARFGNLLNDSATRNAANRLLIKFEQIAAQKAKQAAAGTVAKNTAKIVQNQVQKSVAKQAGQKTLQVAGQATVKKLAGRVLLRGAVRVLGGIIVGVTGVGTVLLAVSLIYDANTYYREVTGNGDPKPYIESTSTGKDTNSDVGAEMSKYVLTKAETGKDPGDIYLNGIEFVIRNRANSDGDKYVEGDFKDEDDVSDGHKLTREFVTSAFFHPDDGTITGNIKGTATISGPECKKITNQYRITLKGELVGEKLVFKAGESEVRIIYPPKDQLTEVKEGIFDSGCGELPAINWEWGNFVFKGFEALPK